MTSFRYCSVGFLGLFLVMGLTSCGPNSTRRAELGPPTFLTDSDTYPGSIGLTQRRYVFEAESAISGAQSISAVDHTARSLTLVTEVGEPRTYFASEDVVDFDKIRVGDKVNTICLSESVYYSPPGAIPTTESAKESAARSSRRAEKGKWYRIGSAVPAQVVSVDPETSIVSFQLRKGTVAYKAAPDVALSSLKVGDQVVVQRTEWMTLEIEH